ncbi:MAG: hypothetical protein PVI90_14855 [Desulfobacteraceae bacterium]
MFCRVAAAQGARRSQHRDSCRRSRQERALQARRLAVACKRWLCH